MSEWDTVISVLGTLGGLLVGYWISTRIEARREKHEIEMEYRKELTKHMDDIMKPLYHFIQELWGSLVVLSESVRMKSSITKGKTLKDLLLETQKAQQDLKEFYLFNEIQIDLLFPHSLSTWVFAPIDESLDKIMTQISEGKEPMNEMTQVINALMKYQKNMKRLLGYETDKKLENVYPFA
jgi:hypothetical protein